MRGMEDATPPPTRTRDERRERELENRITRHLVISGNDLVDAGRAAGLRGSDEAVYERVSAVVQRPHVRRRAMALVTRYAGAEAASRLRPLLDPEARQLLTPEGRMAFLASIASGQVRDFVVHKGEKIEVPVSVKTRLECIKLLGEMQGDAAPKKHLHGHVWRQDGQEPQEDDGTPEGVQVIFEALPEDTEE